MKLKPNSHNTIKPIDTHKLWPKKESNKAILLDADAIISIMSFDATQLMDTFLKEEISFYIIHPISIELLKTDNVKDRIKRQDFLSKYNIVSLPMIKKQLDYALDIQTWLVKNKYFKASAVDLYLAGTLMQYNKSGVYLLTGNISDFPRPLFIRHANILLENKNSGKLLYFLNIDENELTL